MCPSNRRLEPARARLPGAGSCARETNGLDLAVSLRVAVNLAAAIGALHRQGIIHKDIKPANVLADLASGQCWLTGFGIASRLPREHQLPAPPEFIAGTLAYMAPEQTGRMNRSIDSRSDLYALASRFTKCSLALCPSRLLIQWNGCTVTSPDSRSPRTNGPRLFRRRFRPL